MAINYTDLQGNCPDPSLMLVEMYKSLATAVQEYVCAERGVAVEQFQAEIARLQAEIDGLVSAEGLAEKIGILQEFIASLDQNEDGTIDALVSLQKLAEEAKIAADLALTNANEAIAEIARINSRISEFQLSIQKTLADHSERITALENGHAAVTTRVTEIEKSLIGIEPGITEERFAEMICEQNRKLVLAHQAGIDAMKLIFSQGCDDLTGGIKDEPPAGGNDIDAPPAA